MKIWREFALSYLTFFTPITVIMVLVTPSLAAIGNVVNTPPDAAKATHPESETDTTLGERPILDQKTAKNVIESVLAGDEFHEKKTTKTIPFLEKFFEGREPERRHFGSLPDWLVEIILWFAKSIKLILYCIVFALLVFCILRYRHWATQFRKIKKPLKEVKGPQTLFGLDLREKSLPKNIPHEVKILWRNNKPREALSLLYRASLARLITRYTCVFLKGNTEEECMALVKQKQSLKLSLYFSEITKQWQILAYGHRLPDGEIIEKLCCSWSQYFEDFEDDQTQKTE